MVDFPGCVMFTRGLQTLRGMRILAGACRRQGHAAHRAMQKS